MSTEDIISARRDAAIQKWTEAVFAMYPFETTRSGDGEGHGRFRPPAGDAPDDPADEDNRGQQRQRHTQQRLESGDLKPEQAVGVLYLYKSVLDRKSVV